MITILFAVILLAITMAANTGVAEPLFRLVRSFPGGDKLAHVGLLAMMSLLLNLSLDTVRFARLWGQPRRGTLILMVLVTVEEFGQMASAYRTFDWGDLAANYLGILLGSWLARRFVARKLAS